MMRKSTLALIILIGALMFYTGCDGDDDNGQGPPGGGVPRACDNCPCDFFSVPMTPDCWVSGGEGPTFVSRRVGGAGSTCSLIPPTLGSVEGMGIFSEVLSTDVESVCLGHERCCLISKLATDICRAVDVPAQSLSADRAADCRICLEEYATELNRAFPVSDGPQPFMCITP